MRLDPELTVKPLPSSRIVSSPFLLVSLIRSVSVENKKYSKSPTVSLVLRTYPSRVFGRD